MRGDIRTADLPAHSAAALLAGQSQLLTDLHRQRVRMGTAAIASNGR
jgi:hypothetical protein